ncbi:MAG: TolC family protein [Sphingomonadales bacterium]|nr:TolC family protein [Sphingomonadales bacterium]
MQLSKITMVSWSCLWLACACAPQVRLPSPDVRLPERFEQRPDAAPIDLDRWWDRFDDPQLAALVTTALDRSTTIRIAWSRLAEARAQRAATAAGTLPSGSLTVGGSRQGQEALWGNGASIPASNSYTAGFFPSWDVDLFGRLAAVRTRARLDLAASSMDFAATRLALAADVATALVQARSLAAQLADARESAGITGKLAASARLGVARGLSARQDLARLEADAASSEAEVARLDAELTAAKRLLLIQTGEPDAPTTSLAIAGALPTPPALPDLAPASLLARRPDVRSAELALRSAAKQVTIDRLSLYPSFNLKPGAQAIASDAGGAGLWSIAAGMAVPVLDRPRLMANLRLSEARGGTAVYSYEAKVRTAFGEAANALTRIAADRTRVSRQQVASTQADAAFAAARTGYAAGLTDLTTLLQAERTAIQNRSALTAARTAHLVDTISAIRALGGGWTPSSAPSFADTSPAALVPVPEHP